MGLGDGGQCAQWRELRRHLIRNVAPPFDAGTMENFRWRDAARFLGLDQGQRTRERLTGFLTANGADPDILAQFDPDLMS
jgi:hypothetical protein